MRLSLLAALAVVLPLSVSAAYADEAAGQVTEVDAQTRTIVLEETTTFIVDDGVHMNSVDVGDNVQIKFTTAADGTLHASEVTVTE